MGLEPERGVEILRRFGQELVDRWYPGTLVAADWTGDVFVIQVARGYRLADPIWAAPDCLDSAEREVALAREILTAAWLLAHRV